MIRLGLNTGSTTCNRMFWGEVPVGRANVNDARWCLKTTDVKKIERIRAFEEYTLLLKS